VSVEAREGACSRPWHSVSTQAVSVGLCRVAVKSLLRQWGHVTTEYRSRCTPDGAWRGDWGMPSVCG
jgi:hypothetical protein